MTSLINLPQTTLGRGSSKLTLELHACSAMMVSMHVLVLNLSPHVRAEDAQPGDSPCPVPPARPVQALSQRDVTATLTFATNSLTLERGHQNVPLRERQST